MEKKVVVLVTLCFNGLFAYSQISIDKAQVVPLAPKVAELSKYIDIPAIPMNGIAPVNFSLFDLTVGKIQVPITLSYHASGIKVVQHATWVGLGWNLMPGGCIARTVRGVEDEYSPTGWFNHNIPVDTVSSIMDYSILFNWSSNIPDVQPDFFNYSLPGKSGKFIFSKTLNNFVAVPYKPIVINRDKMMNTYSIIDDDGTKYCFEQKNLYVNDDQNLLSYVQSWNLTKIISADNVDSVELFYTAENQLETTSISSRRYRKGESEDDINNFVADNSKHFTFTYHINDPILRQITFNDGKIVFYANTVRLDDLEYPANVKHALDSIVVYKKINNNYVPVKKVGFTYNYFNVAENTSVTSSRLKLVSYCIYDITGANAPQTYYFDYNALPVPSITSFDVDYWGYYNGAHNGNTSLLPNILPSQIYLQKFGNLGVANRNPSDTYIMAGMLNKITYPTGGYTLFEYEPNKYLSTHAEYSNASLAELNLAGTGRNSTVTKQVNFKNPSTIYLPSKNNTGIYNGTINIIFSPFSPNAFTYAQTVTLKDLTTDTNIITWTSDEFESEYTISHSIQYSYNFDTAHTYQIYAAINDYTATTINVNVTGSILDSSKMLKSGGGLRTKTISYFNADNTLQKKTLFAYGNNENGYGNTLLSDNIFFENYYEKKIRKYVNLSTGCLEREGTAIDYVAQAFYPAVTFNAGEVLYPSVTQYEINNTNLSNGKTVFNYLIPTDHRFVPNPVAVGGKEFVGNSLYEDFLISKSVYKYNAAAGNYSLMYITNNDYNLFNFNTIRSVLVYNTVAYLSELRCRAGDPPLSDIGYAFYDLKLGKYLLTKTTATHYDDAGNALQFITDYSYNDKLMPAAITAKDSKGSVTTTAFFYPGDHTSTDENATVLNQMLSANMIRRPYWKADFKDNTLLRAATTFFKTGWNNNASQILPLSDVLKTRVNETDNFTSAINYNSYDVEGNIVEQQKPYDVNEVYLWGYKGRYPVAKIIGSDYLTALSKITPSILNNANGETTDAIMRAELNKLRAGLPDAQVWTYTYAPLIGMTSETDPAGQTMYYEYDGFGRLQYVKNKDGNIIKSYDYHYQVNIAHNQ